jgi:hypothetical protein
MPLKRMAGVTTERSRSPVCTVRGLEAQWDGCGQRGGFSAVCALDDSLSGAFLSFVQDAFGLKVWMQFCVFSFWNQTDLPFSFHDLGGNRE